MKAGKRCWFFNFYLPTDLAREQWDRGWQKKYAWTNYFICSDQCLQYRLLFMLPPGEYWEHYKSEIKVYTNRHITLSTKALANPQQKLSCTCNNVHSFINVIFQNYNIAIGYLLHGILRPLKRNHISQLLIYHWLISTYNSSYSCKPTADQSSSTHSHYVPCPIPHWTKLNINHKHPKPLFNPALHHQIQTK